VKTAAEACFGQGAKISFFQLLTLCAFLYFSERDLDFVILEAGIGGRHDSTNIIDNCLISVITSIGLDHADILGGTIEEIAYQKAGIIKRGGKTALSPCETSVYGVIARECKEMESALYYNEETAFDLKLSLAGEYQRINAHTAMLAVNTLRDSGVIIPQKAVAAGFANAEHAGRMETVMTDPPVILDGAHNQDGAKMVRVELLKHHSEKAVTLVIGILESKDYRQILTEVVILPFVEIIILTQPNYSKKAQNPEALARACAELGAAAKIFIEYNCKDAMERAISLTPPEGLVFVMGSLYLIGDVRDIYVKNKKPLTCLLFGCIL
jgi:dihydrofolate synthase/folylpolyglutamate synthase